MQQSNINLDIKARLANNDKTLEDINVKMDSFSFAINDQLEYNKKIEARIAELVVALPVATNPEQVKNITTRRGCSTKDRPYPRCAKRSVAIPSVLPTMVEKKNYIPKDILLEPVQDHEMRQDFQDTNYLPFPRRNRRPQQIDEQFGNFMEVLKKIYINIPLLDAIQVPTYAKYIRDIINKKRQLPSTEVIKLTKECSAAILNKLLEKKKDPGCPTIECTIGDQHFNHALSDLGASVSVMPASVYCKLNHTA